MRKTWFTACYFTAILVAFAAQDQLALSGPGTVQIEGWLGARLDACITNRILAQDVGRLIAPFREREEEGGGDWRGEYWGKWTTAAILGYHYKSKPELRAAIERGVRDVLSTQTSDGYIGTYKDGKRLGPWDIWGRKYTLLGLLAEYDRTRDVQVLEAARRHADLLLKEAPPERVNLSDNGPRDVRGLPPNTILEAMALLYQRTGEERYLEFAKALIANWSKPGLYSPNGLRFLEQALSGTPPSKIEPRKGYEMLSCFAGVCEMYRITGERGYLEAALAFGQSIRKHEVMVHGSGSNQELWCEGRRIQTEMLEAPVETCVTATWMEFCQHLLRLTGDVAWADAMEHALYNALLGAMTPDGSWWAYFTPLVGQRVPSHVPHGDCRLSCCVSSGPRGLLLTPGWAVMTGMGGIAVNLYAPGRASLELSGGRKVELVQQTDYPAEGKIRITVSPAEKSSFNLRLRIPEWSRQTQLRVNGATVLAVPGTYAVLNREWSPGEVVELELDMRGRAVAAPSGAPQFALMRGPLLLALDNRLVERQAVAAYLAVDADGFVNLKPSATRASHAWLTFDVPFNVRPYHYVKHYQTNFVMCDYASAGNGWSGENLMRVWLPQPLFVQHAFPSDLWRIMFPEAKGCPTIPKW
jgi:DUF1680 family protein